MMNRPAVKKQAEPQNMPTQDDAYHIFSDMTNIKDMPTERAPMATMIEYGWLDNKTAYDYSSNAGTHGQPDQWSVAVVNKLPTNGSAYFDKKYSKDFDDQKSATDYLNTLKHKFQGKQK